MVTLSKIILLSKKKELEPGREEYRRLMVEFFAKSGGYLFFKNGLCRKVPKDLTYMEILEEIDSIIRGFYRASMGDYQSRIQPLKDALEEIDFIKQMARKDDESSRNTDEAASDLARKLARALQKNISNQIA